MAFLSSTPGQFNHWNYSSENDYYSPVQNAGALSDEKQWGNLKEQDFYEFARANGYTGKKENVIPALLGMVNPVTGEGEVKFGDYNSGGATSTAFGQIQYPLMQYLQNNDPDLWAQFQAGKHYSPDFTAGDLIAYGIAGGMTGMAGLSTLGTAGAGAASGGMSAADIAGLTQMGQAAGLEGAALESFVASGGAMGSTAAGGGGVLGSGAISSGGSMPPPSPSIPNSGALSPNWTPQTAFDPATGGVVSTGGSSIAPFAPTTGTTFGIPNNVWEGLIKGGLGYLGSGQQADAYKDVAASQAAIGAPYRNLLQQSYGKNFDLASQPGYGDAFKRMADIATRQWSTQGNPANTPGIAGGILDQVWQGSYLPALANYRGQLGQFGGLGLNTSGLAQLGAANSAGSQWEAIGSGLQTAIGQKNPYEEIFKRMNPFPGSQNLGLTVGGVQYGR